MARWSPRQRSHCRRQEFKGTMLGEHRVDTRSLPSSPCPLLSGHQAVSGPRSALSTLWSIGVGDRPRLSLPPGLVILESHRCLGSSESLGRAHALCAEAGPGSPDRWAELWQSQPPPLPGSEDTSPLCGQLGARTLVTAPLLVPKASSPLEGGQRLSSKSPWTLSASCMV